MMHAFLIINALVCLLIAVVLLRFERQGAAHRPMASFAAYVLIVAAGAVVIHTLFGQTDWLIVPQIVLHLALLVALLGARGNVIDLFATRSQASNRITEFLRGGSWNL